MNLKVWMNLKDNNYTVERNEFSSEKKAIKKKREIETDY